MPLDRVIFWAHISLGAFTKADKWNKCLNFAQTVFSFDHRILISSRLLVEEISDRHNLALSYLLVRDTSLAGGRPSQIQF